MPDVSVVIPTHNRSALLRLTLASVLGQREVDLEVIVVDDGSTDETRQAVAEFGDRRVRVLGHDRPWGVAATRNHGAAGARGDWLGFIDDDDLWAPEKVSQQLQAAQNGDRAWVYTGSVNIDDDLHVLHAARPVPPAETVRLVARRNVVPGGGSNVIVRRDTFEQVGPFDTRLKNTEDWEMWIRLAHYGLPAWVPEPLVARRVHPANASLDSDAIFEGVALIERRHGTRADRGLLHRWIAQSCVRTGQRQKALKHFVLAVAQGQIHNVPGDLLTILRGGVQRRLGLPGSWATRARHDPWIERAQAWVDGVAGRPRGV